MDRQTDRQTHLITNCPISRLGVRYSIHTLFPLLVSTLKSFRYPQIFWKTGELESSPSLSKMYDVSQSPGKLTTSNFICTRDPGVVSTFHTHTLVEWPPGNDVGLVMVPRLPDISCKNNEKFGKKTSHKSVEKSRQKGSEFGERIFCEFLPTRRVVVHSKIEIFN